VKKNTPNFAFEDNLWKQKYLVIGIDEVGRGALAGPLTLGAVVFSSSLSDEAKKAILKLGINDSKLLQPSKRNTLSSFIKKNCLFAKTVSIHTKKINSLGIVPAWKECIAHLVQIIHKDFPDNKIHLLIDGLPIQHIPYINDIPRTGIVKGDMKCISIAAASIIAKVERDNYMKLFSLQYPKYDWQTNKGYGTKIHRNAIQTFGATPMHRDLFLRKIIMTV
jgi:ribonuclease HII